MQHCLPGFFSPCCMIFLPYDLVCSHPLSESLSLHSGLLGKGGRGRLISLTHAWLVNFVLIKSFRATVYSVRCSITNKVWRMYSSLFSNKIKSHLNYYATYWSNDPEYYGKQICLWMSPVCHQCNSVLTSKNLIHVLYNCIR